MRGYLPGLLAGLITGSGAVPAFAQSPPGKLSRVYTVTPRGRILLDDVETTRQLQGRGRHTPPSAVLGPARKAPGKAQSRKKPGKKPAARRPARTRQDH